MGNSNTQDRELIISRTLNAPIELVWEVWTKPEHIAKWWGPNGFTNTINKMDLVPGGEWDLVMHGPDGTDYKNKSIFKVVDRHRGIVYEHVSSPRFLATITFEEQGKQTILNWHMLFETAEEFIQVVKTFKADEGLKQNIEKLEKYILNVPAEDEFSLIRVFNAPRELVYKVWTDAEHLAKWWGPAGMKMKTVKLDLKPGGIFHYSMETLDGQLMWGRFVYQEIASPERLIFTNSFADEDGNAIRAPFSELWPMEVMNVLTLTEEGNMTRLTLRGKPMNANEEENKMFLSMFGGMQQGFKGTFDQLDAYLSMQLV